MEYKEKKVYNINGVVYKSLDEIPPELKKFITPELIEKVKKSKEKGYQATIISPISEKSLEFKLMKWIIYVISQAISLAENQAMRMVAVIFNIVDVNIYLSLIVSFFIGQVSYSAALRCHSKKTKKLNIEYSENLGFIKNFEITQLSAGYSFILNLLFFLILFLVKEI